MERLLSNGKFSLQRRDIEENCPATIVRSERCVDVVSLVPIWRILRPAERPRQVVTVDLLYCGIAIAALVASGTA